MLVKQLFGAAAVLALSTGLAAAAPAAVERSANVRSGPGTGYSVVATLRAGTVVDAGPCTSWCQIAWDGGEGYMARSLLALGAAPPADAVGPTYYDDDYYDDYPYFGYAYGPSVGIGVIPRHRWRHHHRPGRPGWGHNRPGRPDWGGRPNRPPVTGRPGGGVDKLGSVRRSGGFARGGGGFSGGGAKASVGSRGFSGGAARASVGSGGFSGGGAKASFGGGGRASAPAGASAKFR